MCYFVFGCLYTNIHLVLCVSGIKKNIVAASNRKGQKELFTWLKAITNHLYWSCDTSNGDQEVRLILYI